MGYLDVQRATRLPSIGAHRPSFAGISTIHHTGPDATATLLGYFEQTNNYTCCPRRAGPFRPRFRRVPWIYVFLPEECREPKAEMSGACCPTTGRCWLSLRCRNPH